MQHMQNVHTTMLLYVISTDVYGANDLQQHELCMNSHCITVFGTVIEPRDWKKCSRQIEVCFTCNISGRLPIDEHAHCLHTAPWLRFSRELACRLTFCAENSLYDLQDSLTLSDLAPVALLRDSTPHLQQRIVVGWTFGSVVESRVHELQSEHMFCSHYKKSELNIGNETE